MNPNNITFKNKLPDPVFVRVSKGEDNNNDDNFNKVDHLFDLYREPGEYMLFYTNFENTQEKLILAGKIEAPIDIVINKVGRLVNKKNGKEISMKYCKDLGISGLPENYNPEIKTDNSNIVVRNTSNRRIFVRVNDSAGSNDVNFKKIEPRNELIFSRKENTMYQIQLSFNRLDGPTYLVYTGCTYLIDQYNNLRDEDGDEVPVSHDFEVINLDEDYFESGDPGEEAKYLIVNNTNTEITVRVSDPDPESEELYLPVKIGQTLYQTRKEGDCYFEIYLETSDTDLIYQYKVYDKMRLELLENEGNFILRDLNSDQIIDVCDDIFPDLDFEDDPEESESIKITNASSELIQCRINVIDVGTPDYVSITPGNNSSFWRIGNSNFVLQIFLDQDGGIISTYNVKVGGDYTFNDEMVLVDNEGNVVQSVEEQWDYDDINFDDYNNEDEYQEFDNYDYDDDEEDEEPENQDDVQPEKPVDPKPKPVISDFTDKPINIEEAEANELRKKLKYYKDFKPQVKPDSKFVDPAFPPEKFSLFGEDKQGRTRVPFFTHCENAEENKKEVQTGNFKHVKEIFQGPYYVFKDKIESDDIKQGALGDCYLMSALAAFAQRPELIQKIFLTKKVNPSDYYEVLYFDPNDSEFKIMPLDGHFVVNQDGSSMFANPNGNELWVLLLEKAFAKYEGGYATINGGFSSDVFSFFTGAVTQRVDDLKDKYDVIKNCCSKGYIICTGTYSAEGKTDKDQEQGICYGHAYSLLGVGEYNGIRLVKLRNPWGSGEWTGKYSDHDKTSWTPELKKYFNFKQSYGDDGVFFMEWSDYIKYFEDCEIVCISK